MQNCAKTFHPINVYCAVYQFGIVPLKFRKWETKKYFLDTFYTKTRLPEDLLLDKKVT